MPPKILIIEDSESWGELFSMDLAADFEIELATTQESARQLVEAHKGELAAVVMDACVPGDNPNTQYLTEWVRSQFAGPIIAASSSKKWAQNLTEHGASHFCEKTELAAKVREVLLVA